MNTVTRSIEIPAPRAVVADAWEHFLGSVLIGRRRLACDDIACVSAVDSGMVVFDEVTDDRARITLNVPLPEDQPDEARELLEHKASHDLVLFWSYIDGGDYAAEHEARVPSGDERRSGRHSVKEHVRGDIDQFSLRRTARS